MPDIRKRKTQENPLVKVSDTNEERRCAYVSPILGRCRYWGTIQKGGAPAVCGGHFRHEFGAGAEQVVEASLKWRAEYWNLKSGRLVYEDGSEVPPLSGAEIMAARRATGRMREREPGEDD